MYLLINLISYAHPSLLRYHSIVADYTREDLRPLARSCLQRRLDGTKLVSGSIDQYCDTSLLSLFLM
jgi:hypothetical protein